MQDRDLRYLRVINPQLGHTEADMIGKTDRDLLKKADAEKLTATKRWVLTTGEPVRLETSLQNSNGETEFYEGAYVPKFDETGQADGLLGYFRNITERKRAELELKESEAKYRNLIEQAWDGIFVVDQGRRILLVNEQACRMLGYTQAELGQLNIADTYAVDARTTLAERIARAQRGEHLVYERSMVRKDGTTFPVEVAIGLLPNGSIQGIARDVSERKRSERRMQLLSQEVIAAREEERRQVSSVLHHDVG